MNDPRDDEDYEERCRRMATRVETEMSAAEFDTWRRSMGASVADLARWLGVKERAVNHWASGEAEVPRGVRDSMLILMRWQDELRVMMIHDVERLAAQGRRLVLRRPRANGCDLTNFGPAPAFLVPCAMARAVEQLQPRGWDVRIEWEK